ncbi:MAG: hypothetical protein V2B18_17495 [Pseudomonadota bacterium]
MPLQQFPGGLKVIGVSSERVRISPALSDPPVLGKRLHVKQPFQIPPTTKAVEIYVKGVQAHFGLEGGIEAASNCLTAIEFNALNLTPIPCSGTIEVKVEAYLGMEAPHKVWQIYVDVVALCFG